MSQTRAVRGPCRSYVRSCPTIGSCVTGTVSRFRSWLTTRRGSAAAPWSGGRAPGTRRPRWRARSGCAGHCPGRSGPRSGPPRGRRGASQCKPPTCSSIPVVADSDRTTANSRAPAPPLSPMVGSSQVSAVEVRSQLALDHRVARRDPRPRSSSGSEYRQTHGHRSRPRRPGPNYRTTCKPAAPPEGGGRCSRARRERCPCRRTNAAPR